MVLHHIRSKEPSLRVLVLVLFRNKGKQDVVITYSHKKMALKTECQDRELPLSCIPQDCHPGLTRSTHRAESSTPSTCLIMNLSTSSLPSCFSSLGLHFSRLKRLSSRLRGLVIFFQGGRVPVDQSLPEVEGVVRLGRLS